MIFSNGGDDGYQKRERDVSVGLQDSEEVVVLEETHRSVCNLPTIQKS